MASGDDVVKIISVSPPSGSYPATPDVRTGGSTPAELVPVWDFASDQSEYLDFLCLLSGYDGSGLTFTLPWSASTGAASDQIRWELGIRRVQDDGEDIDGSHSYVTNGVSDTAASTSGELSYPTITFTDGSDMDSWADGEMAVVRLYRDHDHTDDDMSGDAELWGLVGTET